MARAKPGTRAGIPKAQSPMYIQRPKVSSTPNTEADHVSTYLVVKKGPLRAMKRQQPTAGPIHDSHGGTPEPWPGHLSPALPHKHQARSSRGGEGGSHLVDQGKGSRRRGHAMAKVGARTPTKGERAGRGSPLPLRPHG